MKVATKPVQHYPPHLRQVATPPTFYQKITSLHMLNISNILLTQILHFVCIFSMSAEYLQENEFLISQGSVATCLRWVMLYGFRSKFHTLYSSAKVLKIG